MKQDFVFTSESVTEGHPDKLCDQISDAIVDHYLERDTASQVIIESAVSTAIVFIAARFSSNTIVDIPEVARQIIQQVGYQQPDFNARDCSILTSLKELPLPKNYNLDEFSLSETEIEQITASNQVTVFGFACTQTPMLMPLPICLAHELARKLTLVRRERVLPYLAPDGQVQVGVEYRSRLPYRIHSITILASKLQDTEPDWKTLETEVREAVIEAVFKDATLRPDSETSIFINPEGAYITGGPSIHAGVTGRKNGIDTYGEYAKHSSAALSGKDPTRIDRSAAYAARYAAKNVVAAGLAQECEVQLSYSIGQARPVSIQVETFGTSRLPDETITTLVEQHFEFRPAGILRQFNLRRLPQLTKGKFYTRLAAYGQMGRADLGHIPWEQTDKAKLLIN